MNFNLLLSSVSNSVNILSQTEVAEAVNETTRTNFIMGYIFLAIVIILVLIILGVVAYSISQTFMEKYKYNTFSLPDDENLIIEDASENQDNIVNPIENTRFRISDDSNDNTLIGASRRSTRQMIERENDELAKKREKEEKSLKKALEREKKKLKKQK